MADAALPLVVPVGDNATPIWSMSAAERLRRMARKLGLPFEDPGGRPARLLANLDFAFDPLLLRHMADARATVLLDSSRIPVLAHVDAMDAGLAEQIETAMRERKPLAQGLVASELIADQGFTLYNHQLRKRERPFVMRLTRETRPAVERASYYAAYKGVTDILTKYLWPEAALVLTRLAARLGFTPNMVTAIGATLCVLAACFFWIGAYWWGMAAGLAFMVLDTVDGKLARCTITSSKWGNVFDHGIDQVHPPFWWWAWAMGLGSWGLAFSGEEFAVVMIVIIGGYAVQRLIEGTFARLFGMHIHVWEGIDSRFRTITARRNPNMVILFGALLAGRPDTGLVLVAYWTVASCIFHAVRLAQAVVRWRRGVEITSWLR